MISKEDLYLKALLVHGRRQAAEDAKEALDESRTAWEAQNADLLTQAKLTTQATREAEEELRDLTIRYMRETGDRKPGWGVGIRMATRLIYEPKTALDWAMARGLFLSLEVKGFERFAREHPLTFVKVLSEPTATIATDLTAALTEATS